MLQQRRSGCISKPPSFSLCVPTAQRSAHELPLVEKHDMDSCSVLGGQQMILTGQNFSADSKVVFMEKTQGEQPSFSPSNTHRHACYYRKRCFFLQKITVMSCPKTARFGIYKSNLRSFCTQTTEHCSRAD